VGPIVCVLVMFRDAIAASVSAKDWLRGSALLGVAWVRRHPCLVGPNRTDSGSWKLSSAPIGPRVAVPEDGSLIERSQQGDLRVKASSCLPTSLTGALGPVGGVGTGVGAGRQGGWISP
jgi:hypothetical protein